MKEPEEQADDDITVPRVSITFGELKKISADERAALFLLGHASNQLNVLQKVCSFSSNSAHRSHFLGYNEQASVEVGQTTILARLWFGLIHEIWQMMTKHIIKNKVMGPGYIVNLHGNSKEALERLNQSFGKNGSIAAIRNDYSFHTPRIKWLEKSAAEQPDSQVWTMETGPFFGNVFSGSTELLVNHAINKHLGSLDQPTDLRELFSLSYALTRDLQVVSQAVMSAVLAKIPEKKESSYLVRGAVDLTLFQLPFFLKEQRR
jgi:hypothetical protein